MKIILKTPNNENVNQHRNIYIKYAKILFKDFYKHLKVDILKNPTNYKSILEKYNNDYEFLLKTIFKKIAINNKNYAIVNYELNKQEKSLDIKDTLQQIHEDIINNNLNDIDKFASQRTQLIFNDLADKIESLLLISNNTYTTDINSIKKNIFKIDNAILSLQHSLIAPYIIDKIKNLTKQKESLQKDIIFRVSNKNKMLKTLFGTKYTEQIINNKSEIHAKNEVDNFEEHTRKKEYILLSQINTLTTNAQRRFQQQQNYRRWNTTLDEKTRTTHAEANGQIVNNVEQFKIKNPKTNNIEYTDRPKGDGLSPENSINCRCSAETFIIYNIVN